MWFTSSSGRIEIEMSLNQAKSASHSGECYQDVLELMTHPKIKLQLAQINPKVLRQELRGYGAWDTAELADHSENLERIVWLAAGDICEEAYSKELK